MQPEALEEFRTRWEREREPEVALELTRAYREAGDLTAALEVLEAVVADDPTQLEANKLLVQVYSERGDTRKATDRLDLYALLSDDTDEVEALRAVVEAGGAAPSKDDGGEPFDLSGLWEGLPVEEYHQALAAEGLFDLTATIGESEATATLGELFLEQGHTDEAERIFRAVLEREPDNAAALAGLARLSGGAEETVAPEPAASVAERKASVLKSYLGKLGRGDSVDV